METSKEEGGIQMQKFHLCQRNESSRGQYFCHPGDVNVHENHQEKPRHQRCAEQGYWEKKISFPFALIYDKLSGKGDTVLAEEWSNICETISPVSLEVQASWLGLVTQLLGLFGSDGGGEEGLFSSSCSCTGESCQAPSLMVAWNCTVFLYKRPRRVCIYVSLRFSIDS